MFDIEANALENPDQVWLVVAKNIDTNEYSIFRNLTTDGKEKERFIKWAAEVTHWIGHNVLEFDFPVLLRCCGLSVPPIETITDTLVISRMADYPRDSHSIESYGLEFGEEKGKFSDWSRYSLEMEEYCIRDVDICHKIYTKYIRYISNKDYTKAIRLEHCFQYYVVNTLGNNGFYFNSPKALRLLSSVKEELDKLDKDILSSFLPREKLIREFIPKATKYGTISLSSIPKALRDKIPEYTIGETYRYTKLEPFNPSSHKQIIAVLNEAGWKPEDKTKTHIDTERELQRLKYQKHRSLEVDTKIKMLDNKLLELRKTGWKVNETNLSTLPSSAPEPARFLAKRILLEARRRSLTEWLNLVKTDGRIHGKFYGIGAWTHRMAHQNPNTANIPNEFDTSGNKKLLGKELRSLWCAPPKRLLVGVDAEGIQLRIFAHYINDPEFTQSLIEGKKEDKSDPHSLNQRILGDACKTRAAAKRFIYAMLLGAGMGKLSEILGSSREETEAALQRLMDRYQGFKALKETTIPRDGKRGYFLGLDGRPVRIPGDTAGSRTHLAMSGYLQNGEAVVMKLATLKWVNKLPELNAMLVNFVHDEWQVESPNDLETSLKIAKMMADSLREVGEELQLKCPLAGSYWNDDTKDYTIDTNWSKTH